MSLDILMPALSPTMEEGTLAKWLRVKTICVGCLSLTLRIFSCTDPGRLFV